MKIIFYLLLSTVFHSLLYGQSVSDDLTLKRLKGKIAFVTETAFEATIINGVSAKGKKKWKQAYKINKYGNKTMLQSEYYENKSFTEYKYDSNQFLTEEKMTTGKSIIQYKIANNAQGKPLEIKMFTETGDPGFIKKYTYNSYGLLKEITSFDKEKPMGMERLKYNTDGELHTRKTEGEMYFFDTNLEEYDGRGNVIKNEHQSPFDGSKRISLYTYDKNNLRTEEQFTSYGYNELKEDEKTSFEYTFDEKGNWIKRTGTVKSNLPDKWEITEREIKYYD